MMQRADFSKPPAGLIVEELTLDDLTLEERQVFGLTDVRPVEGLQTNNKDIEHDR